MHHRMLGILNDYFLTVHSITEFICNVKQVRAIRYLKSRLLIAVQNANKIVDLDQMIDCAYDDRPRLCNS